MIRFAYVIVGAAWLLALTPAGARRQTTPALPERFAWTCGPPLATPAGPATAVSLKDPTVVHHNGRWHIYTTMRTDRPAQMCYIGLRSLENPEGAVRREIALSDSYHCAPQLFYMRPQRKWYLVYQWADNTKQPAVFGPAFSTLRGPGAPETLTRPVHMFPAKPASVSGWLDFWVICDASRAYLFFTSLDGRMWRSNTAISDFPFGWNTPRVVLQADVFEASHTYRVSGASTYLTIIEAQRGGARYYKAYAADRLDGTWRPIADTWERAFAAATNVTFAPSVPPWTDAISHGELIRDGVDETMTVKLPGFRMLFQGCGAADRAGKAYGAFPWRLGLLQSAR